jgi:hypothetical protein
MTARLVLYGLLSVVAGSAAVLSFAALCDLALVCGFDQRLAWLLPLVVDAGAAAGSLVWLGGRTGGAARGFARALALGLLVLSVAANALGHGLAAFALAPAWWVVVIVSAIAPAVLGAVVHLAVLVGRPADHRADHSGRPDPAEPARLAVGSGADRPGETSTSAGDDPAPAAGGHRAAELIARGIGRRRLARELDISEYEARQLLANARTTATPLPTTPPGLPVHEVALPELAPHTVNGAGRLS